MSLTNFQLLDLAKRMNIPLESPYFKDENKGTEKFAKNWYRKNPRE